MNVISAHFDMELMRRKSVYVKFDDSNWLIRTAGEDNAQCVRYPGQLRRHLCGNMDNMAHADVMDLNTHHTLYHQLKIPQNLSPATSELLNTYVYRQVFT